MIITGSDVDGNCFFTADLPVGDLRKSQSILYPTCDQLARRILLESMSCIILTAAPGTRS